MKTGGSSRDLGCLVPTLVPLVACPPLPQQIGFCHMRIGDGVNSRLQLSGLLADLCKLTLRAAA